MPSNIAQAEEDYGNMTTPETLDADDIDDKMLEKYLNAELIFDVGTGNECKGRLVKCAKGAYGKSIGRAHYFATVIAECMYAQVDSEGNQNQLLSKITDHRSDSLTMQIADDFVTSQNGNQIPKSTTC